MKTFRFKIGSLNLNFLSVEGTLMIQSYFFARNITSKNSEIIEIINIKTLIYVTENKNSISFVDIKIIRDNNKFMTSVYLKPTFCRVFTSIGSFVPKSYKYTLQIYKVIQIYLITQGIKLCSNFELFHQEIDKLKLKITVMPKVLLISVL